MRDETMTDDKKFVEINQMPDFFELSVLTPDGYQPVTHSNMTIPYEVYIVKFSDGRVVRCADNHIFINRNYEQVFQVDSFGDSIITVDGIASVISVVATGEFENMYDLSINSTDHVYFTDGVLSHNTTTFAADVIWDTIFHPDYRVGVTSYTNSNVHDYMDRIRYIYENLPWWMKPQVSTYNKKQITFDNGSSITGMVTKENTFRGFSLQRIISDELQFVKAAIADEFFASIIPSIEGDGDESTTRFNVISTPKGTEGQFPSLWFGAMSGVNGFHPTEIKYDEIPGRDEQFEKRMVVKVGRDKFDQEYRNKFIGSGGTLINSRIMEAIVTREPSEVLYEDSLELFVTDIRGRKVGIACDVSEGISQDYHCIQIFDVETLEQIGEFANNTMIQSFYVKQIIWLVNLMWSRGAEEIYYTIEANGIGQGVLRLIENSRDQGLNSAMLVSDTNKDGVVMRTGMLTTSKSKLQGCQQLKDLLEQGKMVIHSKKLLTELKFFIRTGQSFQAEKGMNDDRVMQLVLFCNMLSQHIASYEESVDELINDIDEGDESWGICW